MKRFWIGAALLTVLLVGGILVGNHMRRAHMPCAADLECAAACAMAENWAEAGALTDRAQELWEKSWHISASVANHQKMDEIDALFQELEVYRAREETAAYSAGCLYLAELMRDMGEAFRLNWWNLL